MSALGFLSPPFNRHAQRDLLVYLAMATAGIAGSGSVAAQAPQANPAAPTPRSTAAAAPVNATVPAAAAPAPSAVAAPPVVSTGAANPFDAQRKAWPDRIPPVPPPPPPPPPAVVTDQDLQLYGVVIVGSVKMANVRLGQRFASAAVEGRAFSSLREGQVLGEFTLAQIHPTHVVLSAPGGQQSIYFTTKTDRASGPAPASVPVAQNQAPVQGATPVTQQAGDVAQAAAPAVAPGANANPAPQQQTAAAAPANPPAANSPNTANTVFNSLSEALSAARNNANMQQNQGTNPFQIPPKQ